MAELNQDLADAIYNRAVTGYQILWRMEPTTEILAHIMDAARRVAQIRIHPETPKANLRRATVALAWATHLDENWRRQLLHYYAFDTHWVVHCLLAAHFNGDRLRRNYGLFAPELTAKQCEERAIPIVENGDGGRSSIPGGAWPLKYFSPAELASKGMFSNDDGTKCHGLFLTPHLMRFLDDFRAGMKAPVKVNSCYRSRKHNARVGGSARGSQHMLGRAVDVSMHNHKGARAIQLIQELMRPEFGDRYGLGQYPPPGKNFIHIDVRGARARWGQEERWPDELYTPEDERVVVERQKDVRNMAGATAGAASTAGVTIAVTEHLDTVEQWMGDWTRFKAFPYAIAIPFVLYVLWCYWGQLRWWFIVNIYDNLPERPLWRRS